MKVSITGVVEFFFPQNLATDTTRYDRYRLFIAVSITLLAVILLVQVYGLFVSALRGVVPWTVVFTLPLQLALIGALLYFRASGQYLRAVNGVITVMFFNLIVVVYFLAGPLGGVSVVMIFVVPLFAFVLLGLKPGVVWAALTYAMLMIGGVMEVRGYVFPNIDNTPYASVGKIIHLNVSFFTIFIMVAFYEINGRRYRAQLEEVALNDGLTQLPNRSAFYTVIAAAIEKHQQSQAPFTLIYMDIDNFKRINDKFGHGAGDQVLRAFAGRLKSSVRAQDFVCRLGGDEFAILVEGPDERVAQLILGRLEGQLKESVGLRNEQCIFVSASTGMAYYPHDATSLEAILHAADERMYLNKRESKRVQTAEPPVDPSLMRSSAYAALSALGRSEPF